MVLSFVLAAPAFAKDASRTRLLASPNPSQPGQTVTLTAEVDGLGGGAPVGKVSFADGSAALGTATLSPYGAGQATVAAGGSHSCVLNGAGGVKCWGYNGSGALGDGGSLGGSTPVSVVGLSDVAAIAAGGGHTCALTGAGAVKCWGYNGSGQVGDGTLATRKTPVSVSGLSSGVVAITAGYRHSCALTGAGAVKCWGANYFGAIGDGTTTARLVPVAVSGLSSGVVAIAAGDYHTCALTDAGAVKCWGWNQYGQVGDGKRAYRLARLTPLSVIRLSSGAVAIAAGYRHSCALKGGGAVLCWGANHSGQLGDGTNKHRPVAVNVSGLTRGVVAITAGHAHSCALTSAGAAMCWGSNFDGQLGDGTTTNRSTPVAVSGLSSGVVAIENGARHVCALTNAGAVECWGLPGDGQVGGGSWGPQVTPLLVSGVTALVRSRAQLATGSLGVGAHMLQASFPGDALHFHSSGSRSHTVVP
jgi:alpha-tubulin suppressor-like RCC1 family protein